MPNTSSVLEFKSSTFFTPILILHSDDLAVIEQSLQEKISLAPDFFKNSPLIIDVSELNKSDLDFNVTEIAEMLRRIGLFPIGLRGGSDQQNKQAQKLSIPVDAGRDYEDNTAAKEKSNQTVEVSANRCSDTENPATMRTNRNGLKQEKVSDNHIETTVSEQSETRIASTKSMLVSQPVRSGQRIYAHGDLVVMSQVSAGAEIMAEGNIHIYNTLRGRALAGVHGNAGARIFCLDLQAELVSIAGDYKTSEHITEKMHKKPVQIYLQNHALIIQEIA